MQEKNLIKMKFNKKKTQRHFQLNKKNTCICIKYNGILLLSQTQLTVVDCVLTSAVQKSRFKKR